MDFSIFQWSALILGFYMAWNIGANDVANAIGTSVGSKALTMKRAVILAAICEFCGAFFAGSEVSQTLQKRIVCFDGFEADPMLFVLGMLGALLSTGILLQTASYFGLPISTTHAIIGSVAGFGCFAGGFGSIYWQEILWICLSWVFSPVLSGMFSYGLFYAIRHWTVRKSFAAAGVSSFEMQGNEKIFIPLQIVSAAFVAFAHGANDVSNAIGPVSAVINVLQTKSLHPHFAVAPWLLAFGGAGIVIGLATWGWRVVETIGKKITHLNPARGFAAQMGTACTVFFASQWGLPVSTTHALIGAVFGVGLVQGAGSLNFGLLKTIGLSWLVTVPLCALFSVAIFYVLKMFFI